MALGPLESTIPIGLFSSSSMVSVVVAGVAEEAEGGARDAPRARRLRRGPRRAATLGGARWAAADSACDMAQACDEGGRGCVVLCLEE